MISRREVQNFIIRKPDDLCELAEQLGYKQSGPFAINQLQCNNGAFVSSLLHFLEDNPGAMDAIHDWILDNYEYFVLSDEEDNEE